MLLGPVGGTAWRGGQNSFARTLRRWKHSRDQSAPKSSNISPGHAFCKRKECLVVVEKLLYPAAACGMGSDAQGLVEGTVGIPVREHPPADPDFGPNEAEFKF